jgi:hypothetical protein
MNTPGFSFCCVLPFKCMARLPMVVLVGEVYLPKQKSPGIVQGLFLGKL